MNSQEIINKLNNKKYEAYYIGGFVRDRLLNKNPDDADIVTSARPEEIINIFSGLAEVKEVGKSFGVVLVDNIEVATFRKDRYNGLSDKNVTVTYSDSLKEDTDRRDLTINAIAQDSEGKIYDFHNGISDLEHRIIRFIGSPKERILEDPNRILRACRFLCLIDGKFDFETYNALVLNANLVKSVAPERIRKEILKAMKIKHASKFFIACYQIGILHHILPSLYSCINITQNKYHTEPVFYHNMICGDSISTKYPLLKLTGYLHDVDKPYSKEFNDDKKDWTFYDHHKIGYKLVREELKRLKFYNDEIEYVSLLIRYHMRSVPKNKKGYRRLLNVLSSNGVDFKDWLRLHIADRIGKFPVKLYTVKEIKEIMTGFRTCIEENHVFGIKNLDISGYDLIQLGLKPGPLFGNILGKLLEMVIEEPKLNERETLMHLAKSLAEKEKRE